MTTDTFLNDRTLHGTTVNALALAIDARRKRDAYVAGLLSRGTTSLTSLLFGRLNTWLRQRRAMAELSQLDARMMADIGLDRGAFAAGVIRRIDADRAQAIATQTLAPVTRPVTRHAAEPHLAPAVTPAAANDTRRAA
ncbi:hypothetical protein GCM10017083_31950 [Thalassobaculum fulvum]|uniref:YjiS-like domain-containing protein n=1 Tax=Thalassobaculum fulvum TaxID=1633335 RepID=A0A918XUU3_9PROT|nr:DUF1127 domain-containing protein [Thalassobaculum fulvum]GHD54440.1 hypothetical protein GCM10017083_31950 [Thalassobaculum fulvum]